MVAGQSVTRTAAVLMYHRLVDEASPDPYDVNRADFERHLETLAGAGFCATSLEKGFGPLAQPGRKVVVTFDDGNASDADVALPILNRWGFSATFFVTTGNIGAGSRWLDWEKVNALRGAGMEIGAHGHSHRFLVELPAEKLREEMEASRSLIEHFAGRAPESMSCPGGRFDASTIRAASAAGFRSICTSEPRHANDEDLLRGVVPRFQVRSDTDGADILALANDDPAAVSPLLRRYRGRERLRKLIGHRWYQRLWEWRYGRVDQ